MSSRARPLLAKAAAIAETRQADWLLEQVREELAAAAGDGAAAEQDGQVDHAGSTGRPVSCGWA